MVLTFLKRNWPCHVWPCLIRTFEELKPDPIPPLKGLELGTKKMSEKIIFYPRLYQDYAKTKNLVGRIGRYVLFMHATLRKIMFGNVFVKKLGQNAHRKTPNSPFYTVNSNMQFFSSKFMLLTAAQILRTKFLEIILLSLVKSRIGNKYSQRVFCVRFWTLVPLKWGWTHSLSLLGMMISNTIFDSLEMMTMITMTMIRLRGGHRQSASLWSR